MKLVFDIETNGFLSDATVVHSIVIKNIETNQVYSYHGVLLFCQELLVSQV